MVQKKSKKIKETPVEEAIEKKVPKKKPRTKLDTDIFNYGIIQATDPFLNRLYDRMEKDAFNIDKTIVGEIQGMFVATKTERDGTEIRPIPTDLQDAHALGKIAEIFEETQAQKDRIVFLWTKFVMLKNRLEKIKRSGEKYVYRNYLKEMTTLGNENTRKIVIDDLLTPVAEKLYFVKSLIATIEMVHSNLNDTYYTMARLKEIGEGIMMRRQEI